MENLFLKGKSLSGNKIFEMMLLGAVNSLFLAAFFS